VVADALAAHLVAYPAAEDGTIFTTGKGAPLGHVYYGHNPIGRAVNEAGLPKGTTSHDLRHHYASVLLAAGESVVAVAERLGHEDASLVLSTYGHLIRTARTGRSERSTPRGAQPRRRVPRCAPGRSSAAGRQIWA
jgi:integrase